MNGFTRRLRPSGRSCRATSYTYIKIGYICLLFFAWRLADSRRPHTSSGLTPYKPCGLYKINNIFEKVINFQLIKSGEKLLIFFEDGISPRALVSGSRLDGAPAPLPLLI